VCVIVEVYNLLDRENERQRKRKSKKKREEQKKNARARTIEDTDIRTYMVLNKMIFIDDDSS